MQRLLLALALLGATAANAQSALGGGIIVTTADNELNADGDCSLREAVQAANTDAAVDLCAPGFGADTITFLPTLIGTTIPTTTLTITDDVTIDGTAAPGLSVNGQQANQIFSVQTGASLSLQSLTLRRGSAVTGGAVGVAGGADFSADDVRFLGNVATGAAATEGGGAVYLGAGSTATITNSTFRRNRAGGIAGSGGALFANASTVTITGGQFMGNSSMRAGGAIETLAGTTTLDNVRMERNDAGMSPGNGGALHVSGAGTVTLTGGFVRFNTAVEGGGLWCSSACTMTVTGASVRENVASGGAEATQGGGGLYNDGTLTVTNSTVVGNRASSTTGTLGSGGGILNVGGTLTVTGSTLQENMAARAGGGIESNIGSVTLNGVNFVANTAGPSPGNGGAMHVTGAATVNVTDGVVRGNVAAREGGGFWNDSGTMTVTGTEFVENRANGPAADDGGGGLFNNGGTMIVLNLDVRDNRANGMAGSGGGIFTLGGSLTVTGGTIRDNRANRAGAGLETAGATTTLTDVAVTNNFIVTAAPGNGGGLHAGGGTVTVNGGSFAGNRAAEGGGLWTNTMMTLGASDAGPLTVSGNTAEGNDATQGGGGLYVETNGSAFLTDVQITANRATGTAGSGGGVLIADGSVATIDRSLIENNRANRAGAGIEVADDPMTAGGTALVLTWSTVNGNAIATAAPGNGGGLHAGGAAVATIRKSTFSNNTAREGAGLWMAGGSTLDIALSTVSGNTATQDGGGIYDNGGASAASIMIEDLTVVDNTAGGIGGGLLSESTDGASYTLRNSIVANNTATTGPDCSGMVQSGGYNLVETTAGCTLSGDTATNITGMDPMLYGLINNGGPTRTHLPMPGSPVINAGQSNYEVDQRDFVRAVGQHDIGSVERNAVAPTALVAEATDASAKDGDATAEFALSAPSPNPTRGEATIRFTVAETQQATVTLHDLLGRTIATLYDADTQAGTQQSVRLDASGLAPGVYVVRLQSAGQVAVGRVTVVR